MNHMQKTIKFTALLLLYISVSSTAWSEPYLAVRSGFKCTTCHTNPTGGGQRTAFGNHYAQNTLAASYSDFFKSSEKAEAPTWNGQLNKHVSMGADYRGELLYTDIEGANSQSDFVYEEMQVYLNFQPVPGRIALYVDEKFGPGSSFSREAFALFWSKSQKYYIKAGRFFLPYGLRLEDDEAFVRSVTGINFNTPDDGLEFGIEQGPWTSNFAVTNGSDSDTAINDNKRISWNSVYTKNNWRFGFSLNNNETINAERNMTSVYGGLRTGPIAWLIEYDQVEDKLASSVNTQDVWLVEANLLVSKGHNLKFTYESLDPTENIEKDFHNRYSFVWEYFPIQYVQISAGIRSLDLPKNSPPPDKDNVFLQAHLFF